jgi:hypothetical protein
MPKTLLRDQMVSCNTNFVRKSFHIATCTVNSELCFGRAPRFTFSMRCKNIYKRSGFADAHSVTRRYRWLSRCVKRLSVKTVATHAIVFSRAIPLFVLISSP